MFQNTKIKSFGNLPSRRHHPLVRGWSQRLHAFPTASNSRVGEEEKMSWGESLIEKMKYGLIIFLEGVKQDYLHNCNIW